MKWFTYIRKSLCHIKHVYPISLGVGRRVCFKAKVIKAQKTQSALSSFIMCMAKPQRGPMGQYTGNPEHRSSWYKRWGNHIGGTDHSIGRVVHIFHHLLIWTLFRPCVYIWEICDLHISMVQQPPNQGLHTYKQAQTAHPQWGSTAPACLQAAAVSISR